jgi:hypothetical protein
VKLPASVAGNCVDTINGAANAMQVFGAGVDVQPLAGEGASADVLNGIAYDEQHDRQQQPDLDRPDPGRRLRLVLPAGAHL